jgi:hypothetical protein
MNAICAMPTGISRPSSAAQIGFRIPSLTKRIAARTSLQRVIRHSLGLKAPRGFGWLTNPKRAAYNHVYNRTSVGCGVVLMFASATAVAGAVVWLVA